MISSRLIAAAKIKKRFYINSYNVPGYCYWKIKHKTPQTLTVNGKSQVFRMIWKFDNEDTRTWHHRFWKCKKKLFMYRVFTIIVYVTHCNTCVTWEGLDWSNCIIISGSDSKHLSSPATSYSMVMLHLCLWSLISWLTSSADWLLISMWFTPTTRSPSCITPHL